MSNPPILVIGATGKTGRRVAQRLELLGHDVRRGSRTATPPFDWPNRATWAPALEGVKAMYVAYYPDLLVPEAVEDIRALTVAAIDAGVEHMVLLSGRGERNAELCEQVVRESGLSFTLVRASWFFQNFTEGMLLQPVMDGAMALPAGQVREPFVDARDVADVAVAALTDPLHVGKLYEVTGPDLISFADAAGQIGEASGRPVEYVPVTLEQFHEGLEAAAGAEAAYLWTALCGEVLDGHNEYLSTGVREALGREPRDFASFVRESAVSGAWSR